MSLPCNSKPSRIQITKFIASEAAKPFIWGETDCCTFVNRFVQTFYNISPLDLYGRKHSCESEAKAWLSEKGGIVKAVCRVMRKSKFRQVKSFGRGDIGLLQLASGLVAMSIFDGSFWYTRHESGLIGVIGGKAKILKAWECRA